MILDTLVELAPPAAAFGYGEPDGDGRPTEVRDVAAPFSAFVFKVQAA